ncbi:transcription cofactor vestigial-like protein 4, partial [Mustelus asterias]
HPSLKSGDRQEPATSARTAPPPDCPIKRKHLAEPNSISQSVEGRLPKAGRPLALAMVDRPVASKGLGEPGRSPGLAATCPHHKPLPQARGPPADQPLALIKKRPCPSRATSDPSSALPPSMLQQMRPSVITCASSSYRHCGHSRTSAMNEHKTAVSFSYRPDTEAPDRTVSCDSVVDEHFRRSLGREYQLPAPPANSVSISGSVDDHFAKALGEKWLQIKGGGDSSPEDSAPTNEGTPCSEKAPILFS